MKKLFFVALAFCGSILITSCEEDVLTENEEQVIENHEQQDQFGKTGKDEVQEDDI